MTNEQRSEAARLLGGIRSEAKREAARRRMPQRPDEELLPCTCGRGEGERHAVRCPVRNREDARARRERTRAGE